MRYEYPISYHEINISYVKVIKKRVDNIFHHLFYPIFG